MSSKKYCSFAYDNKHKLSFVEKVTGNCKWCSKCFCQQHSAVEQHYCKSYDRERDIMMANAIKEKSMTSKEYIDRGNCAY